MTNITLRLLGSHVYVVDPEYAAENTDELFTDVILSFDDVGTFVTAQLVRRNEEQTSGDEVTS